MLSLAIKYRPKSFDDLTEQAAIKYILEEQLKTGSHVNAYLFVGGAGTGKTTSARIFAKKINQDKGTPIEVDAASNNGVDDVRGIIKDAKFKALDAEFKTYIIDECHMLSTGAWNAMLKLLEEPPVHTIFIMCTTDPQKIPATILSRVQRYDFQRISYEGIVARLKYIIEQEAIEMSAEGEANGNYIEACDIFNVTDEAIEYIAKIADGGMRDAITLLDKCLSYSYNLGVEEVTKALGTVNYQTMFELTNCLLTNEHATIIEIIEEVHRSGADLKQFIKQYQYFLVDLLKYQLSEDYEYLQIPSTYGIEYLDEDFGIIRDLLKTMVELNASIKWEQNPKPMIEAEFLLF